MHFWSCFYLKIYKKYGNFYEIQVLMDLNVYIEFESSYNLHVIYYGERIAKAKVKTEVAEGKSTFRNV